MAYAETGTFSKLVVEVEWTPGSGVYAKWCGLTSRGVNRQHNMNTNPVPECDDEDKPAQVERAVESSEVSIAGSGVWARQSHGNAMDWWYSAQTRNVRVQYVDAPNGTTEYETGPAYLVTLNNTVERGSKIEAEIAIEFDGLPSRTAAN